MKIPLKYIDGRIFVNTSIIVQGAHMGVMSVAFIIDTGSPETFLSEGEAQKYNIPLNKCSFERPTRMGGSKYIMGDLKKPTNIYFKNEEGKSFQITVPSIAIATNTKKTADERDISLNFPSIMGTDFLEKNNFILYCNLSKGECYLELKQ